MYVNLILKRNLINIYIYSENDLTFPAVLLSIQNRFKFFTIINFKHSPFPFRVPKLCVKGNPLIYFSIYLLSLLSYKIPVVHKHLWYYYFFFYWLNFICYWSHFNNHSRGGISILFLIICALHIFLINNFNLKKSHHVRKFFVYYKYFGNKKKIYQFLTHTILWKEDKFM